MFIRAPIRAASESEKANAKCGLERTFRDPYHSLLACAKECAAGLAQASKSASICFCNAQEPKSHKNGSNQTKILYKMAKKLNLSRFA